MSDKPANGWKTTSHSNFERSPSESPSDGLEVFNFNLVELEKFDCQE